MDLATEIEAMQLLTSLLSIVAFVGAVALLVTRGLASRSALAYDLGSAVSRLALPLAWVVAAGSMLGSLYFSERANFTPCLLCWYQRIAMYPLAVVLFVAMLRRDRSVAWYAVPVAAIGMAVAGYHRLIEWRPSMDQGGCDIAVPCSAPWFTRFGFVTLAMMAFFGFFAIIVFLTVRFAEYEGDEEYDGDEAAEEAVDEGVEDVEAGGDGGDGGDPQYAGVRSTEE